MFGFLLLASVGCATRAPLGMADWRESLAARPLRAGGVEIDAAAPSAPGDLYDRTDEDRRDGPVRGMLVCRVRVLGHLEGLERTPDRIVEIGIGERVSVFFRPDTPVWDFSVGLVELEPGDRVRLRVTDDALGAKRVLLEGERRYDGWPLGWTARPYGVRSSVRCRIPPRAMLQRELAVRLRRLRRGGDVREVAAIVGWSDPRVRPFVPKTIRKRAEPGRGTVREPGVP